MYKYFKIEEDSTFIENNYLSMQTQIVIQDVIELTKKIGADYALAESRMRLSRIQKFGFKEKPNTDILKYISLEDDMPRKDVISGISFRGILNTENSSGRLFQEEVDSLNKRLLEAIEKDNTERRQFSEVLKTYDIQVRRRHIDKKNFKTYLRLNTDKYDENIFSVPLEKLIEISKEEYDGEI